MCFESYSELNEGRHYLLITSFPPLLGVIPDAANERFPLFRDRLLLSMFLLAEAVDFAGGHSGLTH